MTSGMLGRWLLLTLLYVVAGAASAAEDAKSLMFRGVSRSYVVRAPALPAATAAKVPLVIVLHGGGKARLVKE